MSSKAHVRRTSTAQELGIPAFTILLCSTGGATNSSLNPSFSIKTITRNQKAHKGRSSCIGKAEVKYRLLQRTI